MDEDQDQNPRAADALLLEQVVAAVEFDMLASTELRLRGLAEGAGPELARRVVTYATASLLGKLMLAQLQSDGPGVRPALESMMDALHLLIAPTKTSDVH